MKSILKNSVLASLVAFISLSFFSCSADDEFAPTNVNTRAIQQIIIVSGIIDTNTTWYSSNTYQLSGKVFVTNGAKLTIQAGTRIEGLASSTPTSASALIITRGSQIEALGSASNPVVFTASNGTKGGWGGLVLLGNARINQSANKEIEGIDPDSVPAGVNVTYGRADDTYNTESSGILNYVRVEYAGAKIIEGNELNSFTFGGVGSGTQLNYLQAYYGADDAFEFFGGTVNAKYLISTGADDDAFDFDFGYQGKLQYLVSVIDPTKSYSGNPNGIESDNDGDASENTPKTHAVISNITIAGTSTGTVAGGGVGSTHELLYAAHIRKNSGITIVNGIFYGFPNGIVNNGGATNSITLNTNVGTAYTSAYVGFSVLDSTNITVANPDSLILTDPFGTYNSGISYKNEGLTPYNGDAAGAPYDASLLDSFFDYPWNLGGSNDVNGNNWLNASWVL